MAKKGKSFVQENKKGLIIAGVILLVIIGVSYAWLTLTINGSSNNVIVGGSLQLSLGNESPIVKIGGAYGYAVPLANADGYQTTPYTFTLTNNSEVPVTYSLYLDNVDSYTDANSNTVSITSSSRINGSKLKYSLLSGTGTLPAENITYISKCDTVGMNPHLNDAITNNLDIISVVENSTASCDDSGVQTIQPGQSINYQLRIWINSTATNDDVYDSANSINKVFAAKLRVEAQQYHNDSSYSPYNSGY